VHSVLDLGGGRDTTFSNNLVNASGDKPVNLATRAHGCHKGEDPYDFLKRVPYNVSGPWSKYPHLANITHDDPCDPKYNLIVNNVMCHGAKTLIDLYHCHDCFPRNTEHNNTQC
jgi:hypothetical protein